MNESELEEAQRLIDAISAELDKAQEILDRDRSPPIEEVKQVEE